MSDPDPDVQLVADILSAEIAERLVAQCRPLEFTPMITPEQLRGQLLAACADFLPVPEIDVWVDPNDPRAMIVSYRPGPRIKWHIDLSLTEVERAWAFSEIECPGHVGSDHNRKICARCGTHIDSLRPGPSLE